MLTFLTVVMISSLAFADSTLVFLERGGRYSEKVDLDSSFNYYAFQKRDSINFSLKEINLEWGFKVDTLFSNGLYQNEGFEIIGDYYRNFIVAANYQLDASFYIFQPSGCYRYEFLYPGNHCELYKYVFRLRAYNSFPITLFSYGSVTAAKSEVRLAMGNIKIEDQIIDEIPVLKFEGKFQANSTRPDFVLKIGDEHFAYLSSKEKYKKVGFKYIQGDCVVGF